MAKLIKSIILLCLPAVAMIAMIPFVTNDYTLTLIYVVIIGITLLYKSEQKDILAMFFGLIIITFFEFIFVKAGVETFNRRTLFGIMPLWLPFLWAYAFILLKRGLKILEKA